MVSNLPPIKPDEKLIFECQTLLPKLGNSNTGHSLASVISSYNIVCYGGRTDLVEEFEKKLRKRLYDARQELAKQYGE